MGLAGDNNEGRSNRQGNDIAMFAHETSPSSMTAREITLA
jgi:hypothetical protein